MVKKDYIMSEGLRKHMTSVLIYVCVSFMYVCVVCHVCVHTHKRKNNQMLKGEREDDNC